jgi:hypothetical protein
MAPITQGRGAIYKENGDHTDASTEKLAYQRSLCFCSLPVTRQMPGYTLNQITPPLSSTYFALHHSL